MLGNAALLGPESGAQLVFVALAAMPFAMFDLSDRVPLASCVAFSIACFAAVEAGWLAGLQDPSAAAAAAGYYPYSAIVTLAALVFSLYMTSAANAQAEQSCGATSRSASAPSASWPSPARRRSTPRRWPRWAR